MHMLDYSVEYYEKKVKDYEEFLAKPHPEHFYTKVIEFPAKFNPKRTNEQHIQVLIKDAKEQLVKLRSGQKSDD